MTPDQFVAAQVARLRAKGAELRSYGCVEAAATCDTNAKDLEDAGREWWLETLPVTTAAVECGYSADRLREMCRDNVLPHSKGNGPNSHLRIARCDLPRKPTRPDPEVSHIEAKLLPKRA